ncbi:MAG: fumarate reductase subunit C [Rhodospirillales bacterium]|nr:fumarate reductase subunit C [Rhodospirillales bacterium]
MSGRKPYVRHMSKTSWFLTHARFKSYMLHEVSSVFVALYMWLLIDGLFGLAGGPESWQAWINYVKSPFVVIFSLVAFAFFVVHTMSWFKAVPQAMRIQQGEHFVPGNLIVGAHYAVLGVVSIFVLILAGVA